MRRTFLVAGVAILLPVLAHAQVNDKPTAVTVTTSSGNCLAQNNSRVSLSLDASAATANIGYCQGNGCTAVLGTAPTSTLAFGTTAYWPAGSAPKNAFCFISASGSQQLTIREGVQ